MESPAAVISKPPDSAMGNAVTALRTSQENPRSIYIAASIDEFHGRGSTIGARKLRCLLLTDVATSSAMAAINAGAAMDVKMAIML